MVIYSVQLQTPSCTCETWRKTNFPCKHFYAVFNIFDEWEFSRLPDSYRNNVFITLDPDVVDSISVKSTASLQPQVKCDDGASKGNEDDLHDIAPIDENHESTSGPQKGKYSPTALRKSIREKAAHVCDASYTVDDIECLKEAVKDLERIYETLRNHSPKGNGLPTPISPVKKRLKVTKMDYHKVFHKPLPRRKRKIPKPLKSDDQDPVFIDLTKVGNLKNYFCKVLREKLEN